MHFLCILVGLTLLAGCTSAQQSTAQHPKMVRCTGVVTSFTKSGFQGFAMESGCETLDLTVVRVTSPARYRNTEHMMLSEPSGDVSPFGAVGAVIEFDAFVSTLEAESGTGLPRLKLEDLVPNQSLEPTSFTTSDSNTPSAFHPAP